MSGRERLSASREPGVLAKSRCRSGTRPRALHASLRKPNATKTASLIPAEFRGVRAFREHRDARLGDEVFAGVRLAVEADAAVQLDRIVAVYDHTLQLRAAAHDDV